VYPFAKQKIFKVFSNFSLANKKDEIELWCANTLQDRLSWDEEIPENTILTRGGAFVSQNYDFRRKDFVNAEDYRDFVEKTWSVNIRKLKSGIKIS